MNIWDKYPVLTAVVRRDHIACGMQGTGHDFDHALQAAQTAVLIAEDNYVGMLAGAAGLCHNADRLLQHRLGVGRRDVPEKTVVVMIQGWLAAEEGTFAEAEVAQIVHAVLHHGEVNHPEDGPVLVALKDADRITCSAAENVMTSAQFWAELPALDPKWLTVDPTAHSYRDPKSVLKNLECRYDWIDPASPVCVRLPKARQLMERRAAFIRAYIAEVTDQRREVGLWPNYPG